jgi:hypothetical protein
MFSGMFTNSAAGNGQSGAVPEQRPNADQVFGDVFEDVRHLLSLTYLHFLPFYITTAHPSFFFFSFPPFRYSFYGQKLSGISRCGPG